MKILSIDDSKVIHAFLDACLEGSEHTIVHAFGGTQALTLLEQTPEQRFDLILLDWEMPEMNGPEVVQALHTKGNQIPIVMLTSKNQVSDIAQMLSAGVRDYMMKPFTKDILLEKLQGLG